MSFDAQINFRATSGYVTDGAGQTYSLGEGYSTSRGGLTFGFISTGGASQPVTGSARDRSTSGTYAPELSGMIITANPTQVRFRLDLPAVGDYDLTIALGDASNATVNYAYIHDTLGTLLYTVASGVSASAANFVDINGSPRTPAQWKAERSTTRLTFATTQLVVLFGAGSGSGSSGLAYFRAQQVAAGGGSILPIVQRFRSRITRGY